MHILKAVKSFNWKLWSVLAVTLLIPAVYQTVRIFFLGELPAEWGVNIASQLSWVNLIYEIVEEAFILPLFFVFGKSIGSREELENKTRTGLLISGGSYALLSVLIIIFARSLCVWMANDPTTLDATVIYIRLESVSFTIGIVSKFITVLFVTLGKVSYMYLLLIIRTVAMVVMDTVLISNLPFSLHLGVNGIAIGNIMVSLLLVVVSGFILRKEGIRIVRRKRLEFDWLAEYGKIALFSGLESLVRNLAFMLMVSRLVNVISEQGTYWVANSFIWTWLLLPANAFYDVVKKETAESIKDIQSKTQGYLAVATIFSVVWGASIPLWKPFIRYVLNSEAYESVYQVVLIQSAFYIIYIFNCIFDGTIYGRGKTGYMLIESITTNGIYYVIMFLLWITGTWIPTLNGIAWMFGIGMAFDLIPTLACYIYLRKKLKDDHNE